MTGEGRLVRDCMRERIAAVRPFVRPVVGYTERVRALRAKLLEEATEVALAESREAVIGELADVIQIVMDFATAIGSSTRDIEVARLAKFKAKGGFAAGVMLAWQQPEDIPQGDEDSHLQSHGDGPAHR